MSFYSIAELLSAVEQTGQPMWHLLQESDCFEREVSKEASMAQMKTLWQTMKSASAGYKSDQLSSSELSGGDGGKFSKAVAEGKTLVDPFLGQVVAEALKMAECNACMKRIVAAPTAGSCGVIPAVLIPYQQRFETTDEEICKALYVSAGFGLVIAARASISGAEGGCQAEIGSASAMAAATLVVLQGGDAQMAADAAAIALKSTLGLVCDPVAGLVEVPCVKRNVMGAVNAVTAADMAMAGIESKIPVDEVIDAMAAIGQMMPMALKETGKGGLAATFTGIAYRKELFS